jgi:predicted Zn finger-like uncharacterized protein
MIVKCEQCQTRFKIPDEKVTERGVKVRCTKCQHTFRVAKEPQQGATAPVPAFAPAPAAAPAADPFAAFGQAANVSHEEATRPAMARPAFAAPQPFAAPNPFADDSPTRVAPMPKNLGGMMRPPRGPLGLASPTQAPAPAEPSSDPFAFALGAAPLAPTREQPAWGPGAPPFAPAAAADPFASFGAPATAGSLAATQPAMPAAPPLPDPGAWTQENAAYGPPPGTDPFGLAAPAAPAAAAGWDAQTFTGPRPPTSKIAGFTQPPTDAVTAQQPAWDFAAAAPAEPKAPSPFDFSGAALRDEGPPPTWTTQAPMPAHPPTSNPFAPPGGSMPSAAAPYEDPGYAAQPAMPAAPGQPELPPFEATGFGDQGMLAPQAPSPALDTGALQDASSLFGAPGSALSPDVGPLPPMQSAKDEPVKDDEVEMNRRTIAAAAAAAKQIAEAEAAEAASAQSAPVAEPVEPMPAPRGMLGVVGNITIAAVLTLTIVGLGTIYYNEGKLELSALSWSRFKEYFSAQRDFVTVDLSNGLYETRGGHPVFFVRGEVINKSGKDARVSVRAEIFDGEQLVRQAQGWAGATPNPEELNGISAPADVDRLNEKLASAAAPLANGASGSFLVPFYEYPADLKGIRVKVVVAGAEPDKAAAR